MKIYTAPWHVPHLYELQLATDCQLALQINPWVDWNCRMRPFYEQSMDFVSSCPEDADLALIFIDGSGDRRKYQLAEAVERQATNRGVKCVFLINGEPPSKQEGGNFALQCLYNAFLEGRTVIFTSEQLAEDWKNVSGELAASQRLFPIRHAYHPDSFFHSQRNKESCVIGMSCLGGVADVMEEVIAPYRAAIEKRGMSLVNLGIDLKPAGFLQYRQTLADLAGFIHLNPRSPFPRARSEAMLSGCPVLSVPGHDWEVFEDLDGELVTTTTESPEEDIERLLSISRNLYNPSDVGDRLRGILDWEKYKTEINNALKR